MPSERQHTPHERLVEVASLLARGIVRLKTYPKNGPEKPHRRTEERAPCVAYADGRPGFELGVHGHGVFGVDLESVVCPADAHRRRTERPAADGIPAFSEQHRTRAVPDHLHRSAGCMSHSRVQPMDADIHADLCAHPRLAVYLTRELGDESVTTIGILCPEYDLKALSRGKGV